MFPTPIGHTVQPRLAGFPCQNGAQQHGGQRIQVEVKGLFHGGISRRSKSTHTWNLQLTLNLELFSGDVEVPFEVISP